MGDKTWWYETCPNCLKETLECFEQLTSNIKSEECESCGYFVPWQVDDSTDVIKIERGTPIIRKRSEDSQS